MKIAIIADSHDNLPNLSKTLEYLKQNNISTIIHCGDVCNLETINFVLNNFKGKIYLSLGNADQKSVKELKNKKLVIKENYGFIDIGTKKFLFTHFLKMAEKVVETTIKRQAVFYGHTHCPMIKTDRNGTVWLNPGNLSGLFYQATFAVYDTEIEKAELILLAKI